MSRELAATTPFPNILLDEAMPRLKDTQWRVLCVIVRQTLGWRQPSGKRKTSDWLTQAQLVKRTGRDRAALSRAVDALVRGRYVEVRNEQGKPLSSPAERRQCKGHLHYALHSRLLPALKTGIADFEKTGVKSEYQAPISNSLLDNHVAKSEYHRASKANTTKETLTKEIVTKVVDQNSLDRLVPEVFQGDLGGAHQASIREFLTEAEPGYSDAAKDFITLFGQMYEQAKKQEAAISLTFGDVHRLEKLLSSRPSCNWQPILQAFFTSDALYIARRNHSLSAFLDSCHIFLVRHPHATLPQCN